MLADAILGLVILAILAGTLAATVAQQRRVTRVLAERRALVRLAEEALADLQAGQALPAPAPPDGVTCQWELVPEGAGPSAAGASWKWVRVRVTSAAGKPVELLGVAPAKALEKAGAGKGGGR